MFLSWTDDAGRTWSNERTIMMGAIGDFTVRARALRLGRSRARAFKIAGTMAFKEAARKAKPILLEPIMKVEVVTPDDYMGDVMGDLSSRRGKLGGMEQRGSSQVINALVPLSEMFGYATDLRSRTSGRATYTMQFDSYQQMPSSVQEEIVTRGRGE